MTEVRVQLVARHSDLNLRVDESLQCLLILLVARNEAALAEQVDMSLERFRERHRRAAHREELSAQNLWCTYSFGQAQVESRRALQGRMTPTEDALCSISTKGW